MTIQDLLDECNYAKSKGCSRLVVAHPKRCNGTAVRIAPGLSGEIVGTGVSHEGVPYTLAKMLVADIERWIQKSGSKYPEIPAKSRKDPRP